MACVLLGALFFDGMADTALWHALTLEPGFARPVRLLMGTMGLLAAMGFVALTYRGATRWSGRSFVSQRSSGEATFVCCLVPLIAGYTLAHSFVPLVLGVQSGLALASDPFDLGWDLFGTVDWRRGAGWLAGGTVVAIQVAAFAVGHVLAVAAAHRRALRVLPEDRRRRGQRPVVLLMVVYAMAGVVLVVGK